MKRVSWLTPSYSGMSLNTVKNMVEVRELLVGSGFKFSFDGVEHMPLDIARNEIAGMLLRSKSDVAMLMDDDGTVEPAWVAKVIPLLESYPVLTFPQLCRPRFDKFNVMLADEVVSERGVRLQRCVMTGLGAVLVARRVFEMMAAAVPSYDSVVDPSHPTPCIFASMTVDKRSISFMETKGATSHKIVADDMVFSLQCPFPIFAVVDAVTGHGGHRGCLGEKLQSSGLRGTFDAEGGREG